MQCDTTESTSSTNSNVNWGYTELLDYGRQQLCLKEKINPSSNIHWQQVVKLNNYVYTIDNSVTEFDINKLAILKFFTTFDIAIKLLKYFGDAWIAGGKGMYCIQIAHNNAIIDCRGQNKFSEQFAANRISLPIQALGGVDNIIHKLEGMRSWPNPLAYVQIIHRSKNVKTDILAYFEMIKGSSNKWTMLHLLAYGQYTFATLSETLQKNVLKSSNWILTNKLNGYMYMIYSQNYCDELQCYLPRSKANKLAEHYHKSGIYYVIQNPLSKTPELAYIGSTNTRFGTWRELAATFSQLPARGISKLIYANIYHLMAVSEDPLVYLMAHSPSNIDLYSLTLEHFEAKKYA